MVQSVQISRQPPQATRLNNLAIGFSEEDAKQLHHPHDDTLVINLSIADFNTQSMLVDNGSSIDILYYPRFQQMRINWECVLPLNTPLVGFGNTKVFPVGTITSPITIGTYLQQLTKEVHFLIIDCSLAYNAIIRRPTLNAWREATSTYHLLVKFPTKYRIREAQGDKMATRESYIVMLEMDDHLQALNIEERKVTIEPMEELEEISLDDDTISRTTRIGTQADLSDHEELAIFLKDNWDVFAWNHEDILGISPNTMVHKFNVCPSFPPV